MKHTALLTIFLAAAIAMPSIAAPTSPVDAVSPLVKLASGYAFTEGPASDSRGNVYFTDQPNNKILRWDARGGAITTFLSPCGRANGLCFDRAGSLWACADEHNELWKIEPSGRHAVVVKSFDSKLLDGPNDVWVRPDGGAYFTDPMYKRDYWQRGPAEQPEEGVYYVAPSGAARRVVDDMTKPNGIIGTPDGKTLYVADIGTWRTFAYDIEKDGSLTRKRLFCSMGSDGMTIDNLGNIYLCGRGVTIFDPAGEKIGHIDIPEGWTGNVCFGGRDRSTLFITASTSVYTQRMTTHGVGSQ